MIDACITTLMQGRLFERHLHREFFSAADVAAGPQSALQAGLSLINKYRESVKSRKFVGILLNAV